MFIILKGTQLGKMTKVIVRKKERQRDREGGREREGWCG